MKKYFLIPLIGTLALFLAGCASNSYTISCDTDGFNGTVYLIDDYGNTIESVSVENRPFSITRKYEGPGYYTLRAGEEDEPAFSAQFFVEPGVLTVKLDSIEIFDKLYVLGTVSGTPSNDAYAQMYEDLDDILDRVEDEDLSEEEQEEANREYSDFVQSVYEANRDKYFGAYLLNDRAYYYSGEELLKEIAKFPEELQKGKILKDLKATAEQSIRTDLGKRFIEVAQNDPDGNEITLSSVVGNPANKYVLIDFWASWCIPCMEEVPYLIQTYSKFHGKGFEIYGISCDSKKDDWVKAIAEHEMNWIHVCCLDQRHNQASEDYAVRGIPSNFLIDCADGSIIAKNLRGEDVYAKISELLAD